MRWFVALLMLGWWVHEIPKHKADHKAMRQAELVTALTLLGLFEHWVWAVALFIAYMDWNAAEAWLVGILRKANLPETTGAAAAQELAFAPAPPAAAPGGKAPPPPAPAAGGEKPA